MPAFRLVLTLNAEDEDALRTEYENLGHVTFDEFDIEEVDDDEERQVNHA